jgi:excisionase family DNA binding protein
MASVSRGSRDAVEVEGRMITDTLPQLLTLEEVAQRLCLSPHTIRMMVRKGRLHPLRICRRLLFDPADVQRLVDSAR